MQRATSCQLASTNCDHSVTRTIACAWLAASSTLSTNCTDAGRLGRAVSIASGSYALTIAPSSHRVLIMSSEGASRTSSVLGLNASPSTPTRRPSMAPPKRSRSA